MRAKIPVGMTLLLLVCIVVIGCASSVSLADYNAVVAQRDQAQAELATLEAAVAQQSQAQAELATLQEICPPRGFESLTELETWLASNTISEEATVTYADAWMRKALRLQQDALEDGYIISVDYDYDMHTELYSVFCTTLIRGTLFYWDPETDEVFEEYSFTTLQ